MKRALAQKVWERAGHCCEYCQMPQELDDIPFEIDHIDSKKHGGQTELGNLGLSCFWCNSFKGSNIADRDAQTRKLTPLFNPRRHKWRKHFRWRGAVLLDLTAIGRVTIAILKINDPFRVELRESLIEEGSFPPS
jgi:hypothetical protein